MIDVWVFNDFNEDAIEKLWNKNRKGIKGNNEMIQKNRKKSSGESKMSRHNSVIKSYKIIEAHSMCVCENFTFSFTFPLKNYWQMSFKLKNFIIETNAGNWLKAFKIIIKNIISKILYFSFPSD